ncbi:MAG: metallophosphoesterase, partial [Chitinophagaceae bacterium]
MIRQFLRRLLLKPVLRLSAKYSSAPDKGRVFAALSKLLDCLRKGEYKKGLVLPFDEQAGRYIIFSDQHKGTRNGADDFAVCEPAYLAALEHYNSESFHLIALGDSEELWENGWLSVSKAQAPSFASERRFHERGAFT